MRRLALVSALATALALASLGGCTPEPPAGIDLLDIRRWEDTRNLASDSLATALREGDIAMRAAAARALGRIGHADALVPLVDALDDDAAEVRREAAFGLGILDHLDAVTALVARLDVEDDVEAITEICLALGRLGRQDATPFLHQEAQSLYPRIREAAIEALALLADSTSVGPLLEATHDSVPSVVWRAAYALEKMPDPASHARLVELTEHGFSLVRRYAIRSLGRIDAEETAAHVASLEPRGRDAWHEEVRIADTLGRLGVDEPTVTDRIRTLLEDPVFHVRVAALQAIQRAGWKQLVPDVLARVDDPTVDVRAARLDALAAIDAPGHRRAFERALDDSSLVVRDTARRHLGATGHPRALETVRAGLTDDAPRSTRMAAASGLVAAGEAVPTEELVALLGDEDVFVATIAAQGLADRADAAAGPALLRAADRADDRGGDLRRAVFSALANLHDAGTDDAIDHLRRCMDTAVSPWVRIAARNALDSLLDDPASRAALPTARAIHHDVRPIERDPAQPALVARSSAQEIVLTTRHGDVIIQTLGDEAPQMVETFSRLAAAGRFDGLIFHRVVPDFVVQGGDPTGTGWGDAGFTIRSEWNREHYDRGAVGIAHSGKDTGSCQLFITHAPQPHLDARYTIWGHVVSGIDVVDRIERGDTFTASAFFEDVQSP